MKILYVSALSSEHLVSEIHLKTGTNPGFAVQKFSRLLAKGFIANGCDFQTLSVPPVSRASDKRFFVKLDNECENGVYYHYSPFINIPILRHFSLFLYVFFYVLLWGFKHKEKAVICDVLTISACMGALLASKINRIKTIGIVTDLYGFSQQNSTSRGVQLFLEKVAITINNLYVSSFTHYVLLTEAMNEVVNPKDKPHIVIEALCDNTISDEAIATASKSVPKVVMYAGGLVERYGLKMLVDSFIHLNRPDAKLVLYGSGSYVQELQKTVAEHPNVEYRGVAPNEVVVQAELEATLLVNPRFTTEELTKFSFPSKNMEYMTTGTPLLTTKLPGMPEEYYPHVFLFEDESVEGFANAIDSALNHTDFEMKRKGQRARDFVLLKKNNIRQTERILSLINR